MSPTCAVMGCTQPIWLDGLCDRHWRVRAAFRRPEPKLLESGSLRICEAILRATEERERDAR